MYEIKIIADFAAAHSLRNYPGNCKNIHGHNWKVEVVMESSSLDQIGMAIDFRMLKQETEGLLHTLDHTNLNDNPPFNTINPTAENMARWIYETLSKRLNNRSAHGAHGAKLSRVSVWENESSSASYYEPGLTSR